MPKKRKSVLAEVKRIDKREVEPKIPISFLKTYKTWQLELSILEQLVKEYPGGMDQWEAELEDFVEVLSDATVSALKLMNNELNLGKKQPNLLFSLFPRIKKTVDDFFEGQRYSKRERKILQTSYVLSNLVELSDFMLQEGKSWNSKTLALNEEDISQEDFEHQQILFVWWISYCLFQEDFAFELPQVHLFAKKVYNLLFS